MTSEGSEIIRAQGQDASAISEPAGKIAVTGAFSVPAGNTFME